MKHYFIHRNGRNSEKLVKTPWAQRKTIKYCYYHEDCIEIFEIEPSDEGVTEEDIRRFYSAEDSEVYYNLKACRPQRTAKEKAQIAAWRAEYICKFKEKYGYEPQPEDVNDAADEVFPKNLPMSLDQIVDEDMAYRPSDSAPDIMEMMDEIASSWSDSWQEIYERVLKNHETIVSIAREHGVTEGAVRKTYKKILKALAENPELKKFVRFFD